jgi:hypothetical protein
MVSAAVRKGFRRGAALLVLGGALGGSGLAAPRALPPQPDVPFPQPVSHQYRSDPALAEAAYQRLVVDREDRVFVLTDQGVCRLFGGRLVRDRSYRPLADRVAHDLCLARGEVFYLFDTEFLSPAFNGKPLATLPPGDYRHFAVGPDLSALLVGPTNVTRFQDPRFLPLRTLASPGIERVYAGLDTFYTLSPDAIRRLRGNQLVMFHRGSGLTALAFRTNQVLVGTRNGYYGLDPRTGRRNLPLQDRLPWNEITAFHVATNGLWVGTTRGVFLRAPNGMIRYFASRRWLKDDEVVDLQTDRHGNLYVLTRTGLSQIAFPRMTLADKARHYERLIRERHIRYGLCAELRLRKPGDPATGELIDTDNDGSWSSYYLASQAFHYAVTGDRDALAHAWETFGALERLQTINGLDGFPSRTFERAGFKVSDPDRWRPAPDRRWEWKGHTSSDEITAQTFAFAVLHETVARTPAERARITTAYRRIVDHLLKHHYQLVDADGKPTLWGRWNPEYVNGYPHSIVDRRLNSAELIAFLQLAGRLTGDPKYRQQGLNLLNQQGYLQNILSPMAEIKATPGHIYQGHDMGDVWNHSDDLLAFINYWTLYRYAFNDQLRHLYAGAILDHGKIEQPERNPLWTFIMALTGERRLDLLGALWTLRSWPLDLITWDIRNSHRLDIERLPPNFRGQETAVLLPPGERPMSRWNGNPFRLDGGDGGRTELAGDEFLLPYWMGRYLRLIAPPGAPVTPPPRALPPALSPATRSHRLPTLDLRTPKPAARPAASSATKRR